MEPPGQSYANHDYKRRIFETSKKADCASLKFGSGRRYTQASCDIGTGILVTRCS